MNTVKTIVVDLDRTLLRTNKTLSAYTVGILKACKEKGISIMVATARPLRTAEQYCRMIDADAMVVSNGARIVCGKQRTEHGLNQMNAVRLLNALRCHPSLLISLETGDAAYSNKPISDYETIITDDLTDIAKREGVLKVIVQLDSDETLKVVGEALTQDMYYTVANGHLIQIMSKSATKWNGIKAMLEFCDCAADETAYFGDDHDDIEPLKMCGIGIAVSNGIEEAKAAANYIAESNDADGVAKFIERMIL